MSFRHISGDDIIDVLKGAAIEPDQWHQYILYCLMGRFLSFARFEKQVQPFYI